MNFFKQSGPMHAYYPFYYAHLYSSRVNAVDVSSGEGKPSRKVSEFVNAPTGFQSDA